MNSMSTTSEAVDHFRQGRAALLEKRREIDRAIADVDRILVLLQASESQPTLGGFNGPPPKPPTVREAVLEMLSDGQPWPVADILKGLVNRGVDAREASTRSIISKMDEIHNVGRGLYQLRAAVPS